MKLLPQDRYQRTLFLLFLIFFIVSCINPPYLQFMLMQHAATILAAALLVYLSGRIHFSRLSYALIILFLCLHTLGARYLYSYTPYDAWAEYLLGIHITETFGFERNHFDRVVHFSYGLLLAIPMLELLRYLPPLQGGARGGFESSTNTANPLHVSTKEGASQNIKHQVNKLPPLLAALSAIGIILATSAAYELLEWLVALLFAPTWAESFLGLQGDPFDAQKDMALATAGAILSIGFYLLITKNHQEKSYPRDPSHLARTPDH